MISNFDVESTLTDRYQTTVPETVRRALKLGKRDKIHYSIRSDGQVMLTLAVSEQHDDDPVLMQFLAFLEQDIARNPARLQAIDAKIAKRIHSLVGGMDVDLDSALLAEDE